MSALCLSFVCFIFVYKYSYYGYFSFQLFFMPPFLFTSFCWNLNKFTYLSDGLVHNYLFFFVHRFFFFFFFQTMEYMKTCSITNLSALFVLTRLIMSNLVNHETKEFLPIFIYKWIFHEKGCPCDKNEKFNDCMTVLFFFIFWKSIFFGISCQMIDEWKSCIERSNFKLKFPQLWYSICWKKNDRILTAWKWISICF